MKSIVVLTYALLLLSMFGCGLNSRTNANYSSENGIPIDEPIVNAQTAYEIQASMQPFDKAKNIEVEAGKPKELLGSYWEDMLSDFWEYARNLAEPVSSTGRSSLIENNSM